MLEGEDGQIFITNGNIVKPSSAVEVEQVRQIIGEELTNRSNDTGKRVLKMVMEASEGELKELGAPEIHIPIGKTGKQQEHNATLMFEGANTPIIVSKAYADLFNKPGLKFYGAKYGSFDSIVIKDANGDFAGFIMGHRISDGKSDYEDFRGKPEGYVPLPNYFKHGDQPARSPRVRGEASIGEYARSEGRPEAANETRAKFDAIPSPEVSSAEVKNIQRGQGFVGRVIDWLTQKDALGDYKNTDRDWDVTFNRRSVKNVISHGAMDGKVALLEYAPDLIEDGVYLEATVKDGSGGYRKATSAELNDPQVLKSHVFAARATIDGIPSTVGFVVREDTNGKRYYDHAIKIGDQEDSRVRVPETTAANQSNPQRTVSDIVQEHLNNKIQQSPPKVNTQDKKSSTPPKFGGNALSEASRGEYAKDPETAQTDAAEVTKVYREDVDAGRASDDDRYPIDIPEMVEIAEALGVRIQVRPMKDGVRGLAMRGIDGEWTRIRLAPDLPKSGWDQARKVLAHEIGHASTKYGGSGKFKAVATKIKNAAHELNQFMESGPGTSPDAMFTKKERGAIRARVVRELGDGATKEQVSAAYKDALHAEAEARGLVELKKIYDELYDLSLKIRPLDKEPVRSDFENQKDYDEAAKAYAAHLIYRQKGEEIYADAMAVYMTNPALLKRETPIFWRVFNDWEDARNPFSAVYKEMQELYGRGDDAVDDARLDRLYAMQKKGEEVDKQTAKTDAEEAKITAKKVGVSLVESIVDKYKLIDNYENILRKAGLVTNDGYWKMRAIPRVSGHQELYLADINNMMKGVTGGKELADADVSDMGIVMYCNRVIHERTEIFNPEGHNSETAARTLKRFEKRVGAERYEKLQAAAKEYDKIRKDLIISTLDEAGMLYA
ncbi:MAG: hypothetical protein FWC23_03380 [Chitinispirillia bacterium]|nr:hypothetical protein [Chitinispirillia bacterium]MCL2268218.1 hypothetical protein [Chitinispirillia bacterium]